MTALPARAMEAGMPVQVLGTEAWSYMSPAQKQVVDMVARQIFETQLSPAQRQRISGSPYGRYDQLPDWRKAPFRGSAMRQLGHDGTQRREGAI